MTIPEVENKIKYILLEISRNKGDEEALIEVLNHSTFIFESHWNNQAFPNAYNLELHITPDVYTKHFSVIYKIEQTLNARINQSTKLIIDKLKILPDYDKLELVNSQVFPILTEWEEINQLQNKLIESLQRSNQAIEFQGVGLIARTIMDKLARQVFDPIKHKPKDDKIPVSNGNSKSQLHSYIDAVLSGKDNERFRKLGNSSIDFVEDAIDIMNLTTHKLNAKKHLAEVCVVSTISTVSIVSLIRQLE